MKWLLRPLVIVVLAALVVSVLVLVFRTGPILSRPEPRPVRAGEYEVAWLYAATNASSWERFVTAVRRAVEQLNEEQRGEREGSGPPHTTPGFAVEVTAATFPPRTTDIPEVALVLPGGKRLVFRWYKLTSDWNTSSWVEALLHRNPPPLAIIGGSSSDGARDLAYDLNRVSAELPEAVRPLLLLTTATADRVPPKKAPAEAAPERTAAVNGDITEPEPTPGIGLNSIYPGRTFRFCFTNRQMADAVTAFLWTQDDLRPDADPVYLVRWLDDSYSGDLNEGFWRSLRGPAALLAARYWTWPAGCFASGVFPPVAGGGPFPVDLAGHDPVCTFLLAPSPTQEIDSSVGSFATPNSYEAKVAGHVVDLLLGREADVLVPTGGALEGGLPPTSPPRPLQKRPLLIVTGQSQPSRRFLRAIVRLAPDVARRLVVATGDGLSFNTVYRDGRVAWPIQDLPFKLVFFCHHNPIDAEAGFRPIEPSIATVGGTPGKPNRPVTSATGTEDVLLFEDIVKTLALASTLDGGPAADASALGQRLSRASVEDGRINFGGLGKPLFTKTGKRSTGTGEYVVCLRPRFEEERVLPAAQITVWLREVYGPRQSWHLCGLPLEVSYKDAWGGGND